MDDAIASRTDAELLAGAEGGEHASFGVLFDRHSRAVYAAAFTIVVKPADAEELLSDAFLLLWKTGVLIADSLIST